MGHRQVTFSFLSIHHDQFLVEFTVQLPMLIYPSQWNNSAHNWRIFLELYIRYF